MGRRVVTRPWRPAVLAAALAVGGCAKQYTVPDPATIAAAAATSSYSAELRIALDGPTLRARTPVLLAFRRPGALRIEVPGPTGARLVAVTNGAQLWAVFPAQRAFYEGPATEAGLEALLGLPLTPEEVMDLLVGRPSPRLRSYEVRWGPRHPRQLDAGLPGGGRLKVTVEEAALGQAVPDAAFGEPPHAGHRLVDADEARRLWGGR